jgi:hypothetical protein
MAKFSISIKKERSIFMTNSITQAIFIAIFSAMSFSLVGQNEDCPLPKYLDFFELEGAAKIKMTDSDIAMFMGDDSSNLYLVLPMVVAQLKYFDKRCKNKGSKSHFKQLVHLYCYIREKKPTHWEKLETKAVIDSIYADFESIARSDEYLPKMIMTFDDGPFYGVAQTSILKQFELISIESMDIGKIRLEKSLGQIYQEPPYWCIAFSDKDGKILWRYQLTGLERRILTDCRFSEHPVRKTSLAYVISLVAEGERLTLYIDLDGRFMWYFHSW